MGKVNINIIGKKFNLLTIVSFYGLDDSNKALFVCQCDCGKEKLLRGSDVKNGYIKSCGCYIPPIKQKKCVVCQKLFQPTGRCAKYCLSCKDQAIRKRGREYMQKRRYIQAIKDGTLDRYGIGRGGGNKKGKDSPSYKNGIGYFHNRSKQIKKEKRYCERCNKDLKYAKQGFWCVHHRDHNRNNNVDKNFELLCKRCHQIEHKCWETLNNKKKP